MAQLDDLPADQRAALQLILQQGRSYDEIAGLLRIEPRAVRDRARAALAALGPEDRAGLDLAEQDDVADHLLGQQPPARRAETRALLERSAPARAWAHAVAAELRPLAGDDLPELPAEDDGAPAAAPASAAGARSSGGERPARRSSRLGGLVLLGVLGFVLVGAIVLLSTRGGEDDAVPTASAPATATTGAGGNPVVDAVSLRPGDAARGARGMVYALRQDGQVGLALTADRIQPAAAEDGPYYAVWYTGEGVPARRAGFPNPQPTAQAERRIQQLIPLPEQLREPPLEDAQRYDTLLVTRETARDPSRPGQVVLQGSLTELRAALARGGGDGGAGAGTGPAGGG